METSHAQTSAVNRHKARSRRTTRVAKSSTASCARPLPTRDTVQRSTREGAAFWQLLEFREHVEPEARAGLEAALEASGLLDAWVTVQGDVLHPNGSDAWLQIGAPCTNSLHGWLAAAEGGAVESAVVEALLKSIGCAAQDDAAADSWLSPRGEFRVGRLHGSHQKSEAQYVGWAAREAARLRRLSVLQAEREALADRRAQLQARWAELTAQQQRFADELRTVPADDELRTAHAHFGAAESHRREAQESLAAAEAKLEQCDRNLRAARAELDGDGRDLQLPTDPALLQVIEQAVHSYASAAASLRSALEATTRCANELERQRARELQAQQALRVRCDEVVVRAHELADTQARSARPTARRCSRAAARSGAMPPSASRALPARAYWRSRCPSSKHRSVRAGASMPA
jgi:hypothetical protein